MQRIRQLLLCLISLSLIGCPKDPYRAALEGSAGVAEGVHSATVTVSKLYSQSAVDDRYKAVASHYLSVVTDCNMTFRKAVVDTHNAGQTGAQAFLLIADSFVSCTKLAVEPKPTSTAANIFQALDTAINGISLTIQNAKGK